MLVEGAGSASEVNLRANDIANMGFARAADVPVVLLGDIDRGGVIASLVGTKAVIDPADAAMIVGFIVNRFRGDPVVVRRRHEDDRPSHRLAGARPGAVLRRRASTAGGGCAGPAGPRAAAAPTAGSRIVVLAYPRIANFDDFDPLRLEPGVDLVFLGPHEPVPGDAALVILPGSKATIADLASLRGHGWDIDLQAHLRRGGPVLGICGGYQMLGRSIADPHGIEGPPGDGRRASACSTSTRCWKATRCWSRSRARPSPSGVPFKGYEMHVGRTTGALQPLLKLGNGQLDGAVSADGRVAGCYIHGLLADDRQRRHWLQRIGGAGLGLRLRIRCRRHARPAGRPSREARRLRPAARAGRDRAREAQRHETEREASAIGPGPRSAARRPSR